MPFFRGLQDAGQRVVRHRWVFTQCEHCRWHPFFTRARGTKCFIPQLKCFPCAPCAHGHYHHGSLQYNYARSQQHPGHDACPTLCPRFFIVGLADLTSCSSWVESLFEDVIGNVALTVSMGHIGFKKKKKTKQTEQGWLVEATAAKPWICLSAHFVSAFVFAGSGAMVKSCCLQHTGEESQRAEPYFRATTDVMTAIYSLDNGGRKH